MVQGRAFFVSFSTVENSIRIKLRISFALSVGVLYEKVIVFLII